MRNIAGVIIVDFIDMDSQKDQLQVLEHFNKALKADKARPQIAQLSELGLVELTRKRQGQNIYELFGSTCPTCGGLGHIEHLPGEADNREKEVVTTPIRERISLAEVPERLPMVIPPTNREFRTPTPKLPEPRETYLDTAEAFTSIDRPSVVNISDRSSFQEDDENARRTHRRRNSRIEAEEAQENSLSLVNDIQPEIDLEEQEEAQNDPETTSITSKVSWIERAERTKPVKPEPIKPIVTPPEIVNVEMTPEQQDIYALMGVSPLVLLNRQVKNSKSAIINVILPGQTVKSTVVETQEATNILAPEVAIESNSDRMEQLVLPITPSLEPAIIAPEIAQIPTIEEVEDYLTQEDVNNPVEETVSAEPLVEEPPRRRRRRSSATE